MTTGIVGGAGNAVAAYNAALKRMGAPGIELREQAGPGFSEVLQQLAKERGRHHARAPRSSRCRRSKARPTSTRWSMPSPRPS